MEQISSSATLWGWRNTEPLIEPFDIIKSKSGNRYVYRTGEVAASTKPIPDLIRAMVYYAAEMGAVKLPKAAHIAIGTKSLGGTEETIFVEYRKEENHPTDCIMYDPNTGKISGCRIDSSSLSTDYYRLLNPETKVNDGTAVFLALMTAAMTRPENPGLTQFITELSKLEPKDAPAVEKVYYDFAILSSIQLYDACCISKDLSLLWPDSGAKIKKITPKDISSGACCPAQDKVILGKFERLIPSDQGEVIVFEKEKYYGKLFPEKVYTKTEKLRIPTLPDDYFPTREFINILDMILETKDDFRAASITQILLEGSAGTGKSALARAVCAAFGIPMEIYTCSDRDTKEDMTVVIMPEVSGDAASVGITEEEKHILESFTKEESAGDFDETLKALKLPTYRDCRLDPEGVYEELTGKEAERIDPSEVYRMVSNRLISSVKEIIAKVPKNAPGVTYRKIKSAIIRAIENGYCLVFEEVGNLRDAGALSFLNDVLDKEGTGVINTMYEDIRRHPDFMIIATTNRPDDPGVHVMNPAFRSRFQYFATLDQLSDTEIKGIVGKKCEIDDESLLDKIVEVYKKAEEAGRQLGTNAYATLRSLYPFAMAIKRGRSPEFAFRHFILSAITTEPDQMEDIMSMVSDCDLLAA